MELAERESTTSWRDFLVALKQRGLRGVHLVVSDDHADLKQAVAEVLPTALWQCCYVHFMRNALEARADLTAWLASWQDKHPKLCTWVEANIEETFAYYRMPPCPSQTPQVDQSDRMPQRGVQTQHAYRAHIPDEPSCLRLIRALAVEIHEEWIDANRYLNMDSRRELLKSPPPKGMPAECGEADRFPSALSIKPSQ